MRLTSFAFLAVLVQLEQMLRNPRQAHRQGRTQLEPLFRALRRMQRANKRRKRGVAEKPSVKRRNVLAGRLAGQPVMIKTIRRVVETGHDRGLPGESLVRRTAAAGRLLVTARSAVIG